ncbi:MAG: hypothetical protein GX272_11350 [Epulopiscium sp.]|nr:hypothetical protein [Candidatus Epulonipiscium sp.]
MLKTNIDKLMNIVIVCLCVVMLICSLIFINMYMEAFTDYHYRSADDYIWYINDKKYSEMTIQMYLSKHVANPPEDLKECIAVAEYYKNASYYKMYSEVGENDKAKKYLSLMDENRKAVGSLSFAIEDINEELEIDSGKK